MNGSSGTQWSSLPDEIQLQILRQLDPQSLLCYAACSKLCMELAYDDHLCTDILKTHYPLAHARLAADAQFHDCPQGSWASHLRRTNVLYNCLTSQKALAYTEMVVGRDLPSRYAENLGSTPRERHSAKYNFGQVVLYYTGISIFLLVALQTKEVVEITLPDTYNVRDIFIEEEVIVVLTTRASSQILLTYTPNGTLLRQLDTNRTDLAFVMSNQSFNLVYSIDYLCWFYFPADATQAPVIEDQMSIKQSGGSTLHTQAIDDTYFYQKQEIGPNRSYLLIFNLSLNYIVSKIAIQTSNGAGRGGSSDTTDGGAGGGGGKYAEVIGVNRHVYLSSNDHFTHIRGLEMVDVALPGIPRDDDSPIWDSRIIPDLGAWIGWIGQLEEGHNFGLFAILMRDSRRENGVNDCGRIRGPGEPEDQREVRTVSVLGDQKWIICVSAGRMFVWQLQR